MNHWDSPTYMISVEDSSSLRGVTVKKKRKTQGLHRFNIYSLGAA